VPLRIAIPAPHREAQEELNTENKLSAFSRQLSAKTKPKTPNQKHLSFRPPSEREGRRNLGLARNSVRATLD
jgi:hypothetical protein